VSAGPALFGAAASQHAQPLELQRAGLRTHDRCGSDLTSEGVCGASGAGKSLSWQLEKLMCRVSHRIILGVCVSLERLLHLLRSQEWFLNGESEWRPGRSANIAIHPSKLSISVCQRSREARSLRERIETEFLLVVLVEGSFTNRPLRDVAFWVFCCRRGSHN